MAATFAAMWQALSRVDRPAMAMWLLHEMLLALLFDWMARQGFSPLWYLLAVSYLALTKVRSFYERRAADDPLARSVNNEAAWPWRMLFLNLNYHSVHHDLPGVPRYGLCRLYLRDREQYYQRNHGFRVAGYRIWLSQFRARPVAVNVHPGRSAEKCMNNLLALPMYALHPPATQALMQAMITLLAQHDIVAQPLWPDDLLAHWQDDRLLLSQTCGYPLVSQLPAVQLVGTFHYQAPGCSGRHYRSWLVARDKQATLADFNGQRAVANSPDSHSGYNALRWVAALQGVMFSQLLLSGGHRHSLAALRDSQADIAAIDCVSWALLAHYAPDELRGLHIIGETPAATGLPLITAASTSAVRLETLRTALHQLVSEPAFRTICDDNLIGGFSVVQRDDYQDVLAWEQQAAALGITRL